MNFAELVTVLWENPSLYLLLAFLVVLVTAVIQAYKYRVILSELFSAKLRLTHSFWITCGSQLASYLVPFRAGVVVAKPALTKRYSKATLPQCVGTMAFEQFFELGTQVLLLPLLLYFLGEQLLTHYTPLRIAFLIGLVVVVLGGLFNYKYLIKFPFVFLRFMPQRLRDKVERSGFDQASVQQKLEHLFISLKNPRLFVVLVVSTIVLFWINPYLIVFSGAIFDVEIAFGAAFLAYWVSVIIGRLSGLPGGFGARELTLVGALKLFGVGMLTAVNIALLARAVVVAFYVLTGTFLLFKLGRKAAAKFFRA